MKLSDLQREEVSISPVDLTNQIKIDSLLSLTAIIQQYGVSIATMEMLEELTPNFLSSHLPIETFTVENSEVNKAEVLQQLDVRIRNLQTD